MRLLDGGRDAWLAEERETTDDDLVVYSRIGERSSHTWFVLTYPAGFDRVRNDDGSWTEWGNCVRSDRQGTQSGDAPTSTARRARAKVGLICSLPCNTRM